MSSRGERLEYRKRIGRSLSSTISDIRSSASRFFAPVLTVKRRMGHETSSSALNEGAGQLYCCLPSSKDTEIVESTLTDHGLHIQNIQDIQTTSKLKENAGDGAPLVHSERCEKARSTRKRRTMDVNIEVRVPKQPERPSKDTPKRYMHYRPDLAAAILGVG